MTAQTLAEHAAACRSAARSCDDPAAVRRMLREAGCLSPEADAVYLDEERRRIREAKR